jgi:hypothetical protein
MRRAVLALSILSLWIIPSVGAAERRYTGEIISIDPASGSLVLEEMGASRTDAPASVRRQIVVTPGAVVQLLRRSDDPKVATWPGGFSATHLTVQDLRPGDFVTVVGQERQGRVEATGLDVARDDSSPSASPR